MCVTGPPPEGPMLFSRSSHPLVARVSLLGSLLTWPSTWMKQQPDQQSTVCWSSSPWNIIGSRVVTFSFNLAAIRSCLSASSFSFSCFSCSFASTLRRSCSMIDTNFAFHLPIISFINSFACGSFPVSLIRTLSLKCLMPFAATLLLSSISFFSSSLVLCLCSSSSSLLSRRCSSMVNFTPSWRRRSSWQKHHSMETSNSSNHLHTCTSIWPDTQVTTHFTFACLLFCISSASLHSSSSSFFLLLSSLHSSSWRAASLFSSSVLKQKKK